MAALLVTNNARARETPFYSSGPGVSDQVQRSLALCEASDQNSLTRQMEARRRGLQLARQGLQHDPHDPRAHFALFCHLGRRAEEAGMGLDAFSVIDAMREALDRALELEPNYVDALVGKGAFLIELPWFLGGDDEGGETLLRRAIELDGEFPAAHARLASFLESEGRSNEIPANH